MTGPSTVFDSIESAHEYVGLLCEAVDEAEGCIQQEMALGPISTRPRRTDALRLVDYKLRTLRQHFLASRVLLNDLRTLRRYLFEERGDEQEAPDTATGTRLGVGN